MAGDPDITYDYYYSGYQVVEVRKDEDTDPLKQVVWGLRYVHSPVCRWFDADTDGVSGDTMVSGDTILISDGRRHARILVGRNGPAK